MSFVTRLWNAVRNPIRCVGRDLEGNRFYERPSPNDPSRPRRSVQYRDPEDMWNYTGGGKRLPVQWSAWLSHTRPHPPTIEELQNDVARQQRVLANVALIEARDQAEDQERMRIRQEDARIALQRALNDVSLGGHSHQEQDGRRSRDDSIDSPNTTPDIYEEQKFGLKGKMNQVTGPASDSGAHIQSDGPKIRPPSFLTPAKSSKSQKTTPISSSIFGGTGRLTKGPFGPEHKCQREKTETELLDPARSAGSSSQTSKSKDAFPAKPSRVAETESWMPKARARG